MRARWPALLLPWCVGALAGALALGPALGRGYVLGYDMVFVPDPPLGTAVQGTDGLPRAVPSDAVIAALSAMVPGDLVQSLVLLAVFTLGGAGAARLLLRALCGAGAAPAGALSASAAAGLAYVWNPFVAERLLLGQWAMLLGYAGLPWVVAASARLAATRPVRGFAVLVCSLVPAAVGGFSSVVLTALTAGPVALLRPHPRAEGSAAPGERERARPGTCGNSAASGGSGAATASVPGVSSGDGEPPAGSGAGAAAAAPTGHGRRRWIGAGLFVLALVLVSLPWLLPSLASGAGTDPAGVDAFAARSDSPFGVVGSLFLLGGVWNSGAVPPGYGEPVTASVRLLLCLLALAGWVWWLRRERPVFGAGLSVAAAVGFGTALLGATAPGRELLSGLLDLWPGFGPLRDGQLYVAPLALVQGLGLGAAVWWLVRPPPGPIPEPGGGRPPSEGLPKAGAAGTRPVWRVGAGVFVGLLPVVVLPGLLWGAGGQLVPVDFPEEWTRAQEAVAADDEPGAVLVLPWGAYRGLEWSGEPVVALDPATKLFDRRTVWNDDLHVGTPDGGTVAVAGEDALAREFARVLQPDPRTGLPALAESGVLPELATELGGLGVRYVVVTAPVDNQFWSEGSDLSVVVEGPDLVLLQVPDQHIKADKADIAGLEVTGGLVTVGVIIWSVARSGSSLVFQRFASRTVRNVRKEIPK